MNDYNNIFVQPQKPLELKPGCFPCKVIISLDFFYHYLNLENYLTYYFKIKQITLVEMVENRRKVDLLALNFFQKYFYQIMSKIV